MQQRSFCCEFVELILTFDSKNYLPIFKLKNQNKSETQQEISTLHKQPTTSTAISAGLLRLDLSTTNLITHAKSKEK